MNTINSAQPPNQNHFPLPEFLGVSPDEGPERLPEEPWLSLYYLIDRIIEAHPGKDPGPSHDELKIFIQAFFDLPYDAWKAAQTRFFAEDQLLLVSPKLAWLNYLRCLKLFEAPAQEKKKTTAPLKEKKISPPSREFLLLLSHIQKHAPSKTYELIFLKIHSHCFNKLSSKGKKVYPYGQAHIIRQILNQPQLSPEEAHNQGRNIRRAWAWLRRHGILNKAWNENPEAGKTSGWYVCTSLKQVGYFRDPRNRPQKTKQ